MPLPADLLAAVAHADGGKWVLVIGAGSSVEQPTSLPTGGECSIEAHRRLRADGVLTTDCPNPWDLSEVSDAVYGATGHQAAVVERLPVSRFRTASPNKGHVLAAALLIEGSLGGIITLNFDKAMSAALSHLGSGERVAVIGGPDDIPHLSNRNLVYLHRHAEAPAEEWVLRSALLNAVWKDRWEPVMAAKVLVAPTVVFAGLGSPAAALTEVITLLRNALPNGVVHVYQVDLADFGTLPFTAALQLEETHYVQAGWCDFMDEVAVRAAEEHWHSIELVCTAVATDNHYGAPSTAPLERAVRRLGLLGFGEARGRWLMYGARYAPLDAADRRSIADVLLTAQFVADLLGGVCFLREDGAMEVRDDGRLVATVGLASGGGTRSLVAVEAAVDMHRKYWLWSGSTPTAVVVTGHVPSLEPTTPLSIVDDVHEYDIVGTAGRPRVVSAYALRAAPGTVAAMVR